MRIDDIALLRHDVGVSAPGPFADIDFLQPRVAGGTVPVRPDMFGDNRQGLQRTTRGR